MGCFGLFEKCKFDKLEDFRKRDLFTDVTFIVEGSKLRAHKAVLSARSEVFELMFTTPMTESLQSQVNITDVSKPAFEAFICFLYTNIASYEVIDEHYTEMLYLADKYIVGPLTLRCSEHLGSNLKHCNVVELLSLAECYKLTSLKKKLFTYISHEGEEYSRSNNFEKLIADFRLSEMVVSGITPTTVSKRINVTPNFWYEGCGDETIEIRNNGNIVTMKVELRCYRKTLYGYLELSDYGYGYWNRPVEMQFKFSVSSIEGTLMHSGQGDVWWESQYESDCSEWSVRSAPERRRALFEYCHQSNMAIRNIKFVYSITLSQWVTPMRMYRKRKAPETDHEVCEKVGPTSASKVVGDSCDVDHNSLDRTSLRLCSFLENERNPESGLDVTTCSKLKQYASKGSLPEESEVNISLIVEAHKLSLTGLVQHCEKVLSSRLNAENAVDALILARQLNLEKLEFAAVSFIDLHQLEVVVSKEWPRLKDYPELVATILKKMLSKPDPFAPISKASHPKIVLPPKPRPACNSCSDCDENDYSEVDGDETDEDEQEDEDIINI